MSLVAPIAGRMSTRAKVCTPFLYLTSDHMRICLLTISFLTVNCANERCDGREAYFRQVQIRSADEPMTTFYKVRVTLLHLVARLTTAVHTMFGGVERELRWMRSGTTGRGSRATKRDSICASLRYPAAIRHGLIPAMKDPSHSKRHHCARNRYWDRPAVLASNPLSTILATVSGIRISLRKFSCCSSPSALNVGPG